MMTRVTLRSLPHNAPRNLRLGPMLSARRISRPLIASVCRDQYAQLSC